MITIFIYVCIYIYIYTYTCFSYHYLSFFEFYLVLCQSQMHAKLLEASSKSRNYPVPEPPTLDKFYLLPEKAPSVCIMWWVYQCLCQSEECHIGQTKIAVAPVLLVVDLVERTRNRSSSIFVVPQVMLRHRCCLSSIQNGWRQISCR